MGVQSRRMLVAARALALLSAAALAPLTTWAGTTPPAAAAEDASPQPNIADPAYTKTLDQLRAVAQPLCSPGPPGFLWDAEPITP